LGWRTSNLRTSNYGGSRVNPPSGFREVPDRNNLLRVNVIESVCWSPGRNGVRIVDQRLLPGRFEEIDLDTEEQMVAAIRSLAVRGAPAIGVMAAIGLAVLATTAAAEERSDDEFRARIAGHLRALRDSRPTAVNLAWALDRVIAAASSAPTPDAAASAMRSTAEEIRAEDKLMCQRIGENGATLLQDGMCVLTHCNTGALATAGIGTALAAIYVAHDRGMKLSVFASETRPLLQGSRLTAWELARAGVPVTVVAEGAVASLLRAGMIDACIVGADRIARNGDVANKIGTFSHAVLARAHGVPFYVAAPSSTIDAATASGDDIEIEQRTAAEVLSMAGHPIGQAGISAYNPAFDVTPASLLSAIITDDNVYLPPFDFSPRERATNQMELPR
jgi:methylthioribose-1-phosphate isomerase